MEANFEISNSIYLTMNNPWRWEGIIEDNMEKATEADFFQMYKEICLIYHSGLNQDEKSFQWYFEEVFEKKVIDPEFEIKKYGPGGEGVADWFVKERKKTHNQNLEDYEKIYNLWKKVGIARGLNVSFYPNQLDEIFS